MATSKTINVYKWADVESGKVYLEGRTTGRAEEFRQEASKLIKPGEAVLLSELAKHVYGGEQVNPGRQGYLKKVFNTGGFELKKTQGRLFVERKAA